MPWARSQKELAREVGITYAQLQNYVRSGGAPIEKTDRGYNTTPLKRWLKKNHLPRSQYPEYWGERRKPFGRATNGEKEGDAIRLRNYTAQIQEREAKAGLRQIELEKARGLLVPLSEIQERDIAKCTVIKRGLLNLADTLPGVLEGKSAREMRATIRHHVRRLLERWSNA